MKKLFAIALMMVLALNTHAQDVYSVGYIDYNNVEEGTKAVLYKNGETLYTAAYNPNQASRSTRVTCNSAGDIFWLVNWYDYPGNTFSYTEIRKNDYVYASTENHGEVHISDIYCLNDTLYYTGYQYNEDSIMVATVWKGENFAIHWILGDGIHHSTIAYSDIDKQTNTPYFCGYVIDGKKKASVWEEQDLLFTYDQDTVNGSYLTSSRATQITVENGHVYTIGEFTPEGWSSITALWKDNEMIYHGDLYEYNVHAICTFENSYYRAISDRWGDEITKDGQTQMLWIGYAYKLFSTNTDIYVIGMDFDYNFYIWKNFEKQCQIEDCEYIFDMTVVETSNTPDDYYGYLCQPDSGVIYLNPNQPYEAINDQMYADFVYKPNGLLNSSYVETNLDYGHWMYYYYDADFHTIKELDSYFNPEPTGFQNYYTYENGLLMTYARYYDDYHADGLLILQDSISYSYDELRRLQTEKRFISTTSEKTYEYNGNQVIITTLGYSSGEWLTLSQETRTFSEDSLLLSTETEKYNDSTVLVTYGYDGQRHRTSVLTQKRNNGVWENQKLVQYHFNPYGRLTLAEIKLWQDDAFVDAHRAVYELNEMGYPTVVTFEKWNDEAWVTGVWQPEFYLYDEDHLKQHNDLLYKYKSYVNKLEMTYLVTENPREPFVPNNSEWYYEIENQDGSITYQHLQCAGDTVVGSQRPKIIIRSNTQYDKDGHTEVTHEYVYEANGVVYWWNKDLEEFTMLYNLNAETGDEWTIKVGYDSLNIHVDDVENIEYEDQNYRVLHVSDPNDLFSGDIVCGIGHLTSFFPEQLIRHAADYTVNGMRCYWVDGNLVFKIGDEDCDAVYSEIHSVEEDGPSMGTETMVVYPNPANNILFVETRLIASLPDPTYRITNLMGQTLLSGHVETRHATSLQIDVSSLPAGMYFINLGGQTVKFVKQ